MAHEVDTVKIICFRTSKSSVDMKGEGARSTPLLEVYNNQFDICDESIAWLNAVSLTTITDSHVQNISWKSGHALLSFTQLFP